MNSSASLSLSLSVGPEWASLPPLAVSEIFEHLDPVDRQSASMACRQWRDCYFQRRFFKNFRHRVDLDNEDQLEFFYETMHFLAAELCIHIDLMRPQQMLEARQMLQEAASCDNIRGIRFQANTFGTHHGRYGVEQSIIQPLKRLLARHRNACEVLDLGNIELLTYYSQELLQSLARPQALCELTLASIKRCNVAPLALDTSVLRMCTGLQVLSLDYNSLNNDVLRTLQSLPLRKLLVNVHGLNQRRNIMSDAVWQQFAEHFKNIELILSLLYAYDAAEELQVRVLSEHMPITHVRVLFCDFMNSAALTWMARHYSETLRSVQYIDSLSSTADNESRNALVDTELDPFVMMAWRCKKLEEIVLHGYFVDPLNIVGIARLGHTKLKRLEISLMDDGDDDFNIDDFQNEICTLLSQKWSPMDIEDLHPSLSYGPVSDELRDEYVRDVLRKDIAN